MVNEDPTAPTPKRPRGKPRGFRKPDARRIQTQLRWTEEELLTVKEAAHTAGEDTSEFIRNAALQRAAAKDTLSTPDENPTYQLSRGDE